MPATLLIAIIAACAVVALGIHAARQRYGPNPLPRDGIPAAEIIDRVAAGSWTCHHAPEIPYTVEDAHRVMRERINCDIDECHAKTLAFMTLIEFGRIKPVRVPR